MAKLEYYSLPAPLRNARFIPLGFVAEVDTMLAKHAEERQKLVDDWCASSEYQDAIERAKGELGEHFDPKDYPPIEFVKKSFSFSWNWVQLGVSNLLEEVSRDIFVREQQKAQEQWKDVTDDIKVPLRTNFNDLVNSLIEKLQPTADGKRKAFRTNSMNALHDFLNSFDVKNITDDSELKGVIDKVRQLTSGVDPELLKSDDVARENLSKNSTEVKSILATMVVEGPRRRVKF
jgi:hypothetical protein